MKDLYLKMGGTNYPPQPDYLGVVTALFVNHKTGRPKVDRRNKPTLGTPQETLQLDMKGILGDKHYGFSSLDEDTHTHKVSVQETLIRFLYKTKSIYNTNIRMWTIVSKEETAIITDKMKLKKPIQQGELKENITLKGVPQLSTCPPGTLIHFVNPSGAVGPALIVEYQNSPCVVIGNMLSQNRLNEQSGQVGKKFHEDGAGFRGLVGTVKVPGTIEIGAKVQIYKPRPDERA